MGLGDQQPTKGSQRKTRNSRKKPRKPSRLWALKIRQRGCARRKNPAAHGGRPLLNSWPDTHPQEKIPRPVNPRQRATSSNRPYIHYSAILAKWPRGGHSGRLFPQGQFSIYFFFLAFFCFTGSALGLGDQQPTKVDQGNRETTAGKPKN